MREFLDKGVAWRVWRVVPPSSAPRMIAGQPSEGWLCFEEVQAGKRHRLALSQVPPKWDEESDIQLRQLLIAARRTPPSGVTSKTIADQRRKIEDAAREEARR